MNAGTHPSTNNTMENDFSKNFLDYKYFGYTNICAENQHPADDLNGSSSLTDQDRLSVAAGDSPDLSYNNQEQQFHLPPPLWNSSSEIEVSEGVHVTSVPFTERDERDHGSQNRLIQLFHPEQLTDNHAVSGNAFLPSEICGSGESFPTLNYNRDGRDSYWTADNDNVNPPNNIDNNRGRHQTSSEICGMQDVLPLLQSHTYDQAARPQRQVDYEAFTQDLWLGINETANYGEMEQVDREYHFTPANVDVQPAQPMKNFEQRQDIHVNASRGLCRRTVAAVLDKQPTLNPMRKACVRLNPDTRDLVERNTESDNSPKHTRQSHEPAKLNPRASVFIMPSPNAQCSTKETLPPLVYAVNTETSLFTRQLLDESAYTNHRLEYTRSFTQLRQQDQERIAFTRQNIETSAKTSFNPEAPSFQPQNRQEQETQVFNCEAHTFTKQNVDDCEFSTLNSDPLILIPHNLKPSTYTTLNREAQAFTMRIPEDSAAPVFTKQNPAAAAYNSTFDPGAHVFQKQNQEVLVDTTHNPETQSFTNHMPSSCYAESNLRPLVYNNEYPPTATYYNTPSGPEARVFTEQSLRASSYNRTLNPVPDIKTSTYAGQRPEYSGFMIPYPQESLFTRPNSNTMPYTNSSGGAPACRIPYRVASRTSRQVPQFERFSTDILGNQHPQHLQESTMFVPNVGFVRIPTMYSANKNRRNGMLLCLASFFAEEEHAINIK